MLSFETLIVRWVFGIVASLQQKIRDGLMSDVPIMRVFGRKCLKKGWFCETGKAVTGVVRE
jgi:hypothetical protein